MESTQPTDTSLNNANPHYSNITTTKFFSWEKCLIDENPFKKQLKRYFVYDDTLLLRTHPPLSNDRVLKCDVERTKTDESQSIPEFKLAHTSLLTYYCSQKQIQYIQGLSEVMGIFLLIKYKLNLPYYKVYNLFVCFIDFFVRNIYSSSDITALQTSLKLIDLLLKYHDIYLHSIFTSLQILPELYATGLLMTMFSNKLSTSIVCYIWDRLILFGDKLFPHFIIVAMLIYYKQSYLRFSDKEEETIRIASYVSQIKVESFKDMDAIIEMALEMNNKTPVSFRIMANNIGLFNLSGNIIKEYEVDNMELMPIFPSEIVKYFLSNKITCYDNSCACYLQSYCTEPDDFCEYCKMNNKYFSALRNNIVIIDIRNKSNTNECDFLLGQKGVMVIDVGAFAKNVKNVNDESNEREIESTEVNNVNVLGDIYNEIKEKVNENELHMKHFVLLTNYTDYYEDNKNKKGMKYHTKITQCKIEVTCICSKKNSKYNKKKTQMLNESFVSENVLMNMLIYYLSEVKKQKYVSVVYGGYNAMHNIFVRYSLNSELVKQKCAFCKNFYKQNSEFKTKMNKNINDINTITMNAKTHCTLHIQTNTLSSNNKYFECLILVNEWKHKVVQLDKKTLIIYKEVNKNIFHSELEIPYVDIYEIKHKYAYQKVYIYLNTVNSICCYAQVLILEFKERGKVFFKELVSKIAS